MIKKNLKKAKKEVEKLFMTKEERRHLLVGPPKLWKMKQAFQINFLKSMGVQPSDTLLDIGCGTLRGGVPIIDYLETGNYCGIEVREHVLEEGRKELKENGLEEKKPQLIAFDDFDTLNIDQKFSVIFSFSVLIHLEDTIARKCFAFVGRHLQKDGVFYANVNIGEQADGNWQGFPVAYRSLDFYKGFASENGLELDVIDTLSALGHDSGRVSQDKQVMLKVTFTP
jgi:cyclopropane fatty-acyl-phospholipid synthase-like methyltransferase